MSPVCFFIVQDMCSFYKYYSGEAIAPVLTIFIGGNHEASNYLQVYHSLTSRQRDLIECYIYRSNGP